MLTSFKTCVKCKVEKLTEEFYRYAKRYDGLQSYCKECSRKASADWDSKNKERRKELARGRIQVYSEKQREWHRQNYLKNKEKIQKRNKAWAAANPRRVRELSLAGTNRRRAIHVQGSHTEEEWHILVDECNWKCVRCGDMDKPLTKDHIIPLSKGGSDYIDNIQPLCFKCNSSKRDKTIRYRGIMSCDLLSSLL